MKKMMKSLMAAIGVALLMTGSVFAANVAKIGDTEYATIDAAIGAVQNGETIELLSDITVSGYFVYNKSFTIDGKGKTITCASPNTNYPNYFVNVANGYAQTFKNVTINANEKVPYAIQCIGSTSKLTLDNVTVQGGKTMKTKGKNDNYSKTRLGYGIHVNQGTVIAKDLTVKNCTVLPVYLDGTSSSVSLSGDKCDLDLIGTAGLNETVSSSAKSFYAYEVTASYTYLMFLTRTKEVRVISSLPWNEVISKVGDYTDVTVNSATVKLLQDVVLSEMFTSNDTKLTIDGNNKAITGTIKFTTSPSTIKNVVLGNGTTLDCTASTTTGFNGVSVAANATIDILLPSTTDISKYSLPVALGANAIANITVGDKKYIAKGDVITPAETFAQVGDKQYATLQAAIDAANGATVQMLKDVALTSPLTVPAGTTLTLNLAGRKVTITGADYALINNGKLTIIDQALVAVLEETSAQNDDVVPFLITCAASNDGVVALDDATGGSIAGVQNNGTFALESGAVVAASASVPAIDNTANAVATITGGTVEGKLQSVDKSALTVTGGSFTGESNVSDFVGGNYGVDDNGTVISYVAQLGATKYQTLQEAFAAAKEFDVVTVLDAEADVSDVAGYVAEGLFPISDGNKTYTLRAMPAATVEKLPAFTLTKERDGYACWPSGDTTIDRPLDIVMNFLANDDGKAEANESGFADWKCDFYLTFSDMAGDSLVANECYLAGNYGGFGWIVIPADGTEIDNNATLPVVAAYDANITYRQVCETVKKFTAAIHVADAVMDANPSLKITLSLKMTNDKDPSQELVVGSYTYTIEDLKGEFNPTVKVEDGATVTDTFKATVGSGLANAYQATEGKLDVTVVEQAETFATIDVSTDGYEVPTEGLEMTFPAQSVKDNEPAIIVHKHEGKYYVTTGLVEYGFVTYNNTLGFSEFIVGDVAALNAALAEGGEVILSSDIVLNETLTIPAGKTVTLDLNSKTITGTMHKNNGAVIKNEGTLTLKNGTITSAAANGGSALANSGTATVTGVTLNGAPNADGSWPSYTVNNTGVLNLNNSKLTSYHGALASYNDGAIATLTDTDIDMSGIPGFTSHAIYTYSNGSVIVNSGDIANNAADQNSTGASVINGAVTVNGGTFTGRVENYYGTPVVKGGTFEYGGSFVDVSKYVPAGYIYDKTTGVITKAVAQIGEKGYATLQAAIDAAQAGQTVTVLDDIELTATINVSADKTITLDLNGKTIDGTGKVRIAIMSYGNLTIKDSVGNGVVKAGIGTAGNCVNICGGVFTLESGNIYSLNNGILIDEQAATVNITGGTVTAKPDTKNSAAFYISSTSDTVVNISGGELLGYNGILLWNNTEVNVTGGKITATGSTAIQGNGSKDNTDISISGNAELSGYYAAIYHPQGGVLTIADNAKLTGWTGVVVKGGNVTISGGEITGTGAADTYSPVSSGYVDTGDALYVEHYDNSDNSENYGTPVVTITGGTFISVNANAIGNYANPNNAANGVAELTGYVSGGTFSSDVSALCTGGFICRDNKDGTYGVAVDPAYGKVAKIGDSYYATLADAVAAAQAGETVKLLKNVEIGDSILIDKTLVLDLNCKTITSSNNRSIKINTVGNAAEEVVIRNGAVVSTPDGGRCIQLGGDSLKKLELDGVTLKAENGQYTQTITLAETNSTEPLEFVVKNSTVVASDNNGYAVIFFCPVDVTIEESTMSGFAALYFKNFGAANDSSGSEVSIKDSRLIGTNVQGGNNTFGTISTEADNIAITVSGGSITAKKTDASIQTIVYCGWTNDESTGLNASFDTELILGEGCRILDEYEDMSVQTVAVRAVYAQVLENAGYVVQEVEGATDMIQILGLKVAEVNGVNYASLQAAVDAAQADDVITFLCDVEQTDGVLIADKKLAINLNGKTFTVSNGGSTNNRNFKINGASEVVISNGTMVAAGDYNSGAYGTVRTEGTAKVELQDLKLYNYRGNGLNVKACTGTSVTMTDVEIYAQYGGGVEAAGGTIELTDVVVQQKGMYTAPWNSMAISVNGGGTVTVQSGTYSTECLTAEEANNQGTSHGPWVAGVLNSGGTLIINGGTFSNDNFGENSLATYARGAILADTGANIQINGGTFNALKGIVDVQNNLGDASKNPTGEIKGGTFSADPTNDYIKLAEGYQSVKQPGEELWQVGKLPNAEVVNMGPTEISDYKVWNGSLMEGTTPINLQVALEFIAKDTPEQADANAYGDYTTDFYITIDGAENGSFVANGCYLAGNYGTFGWIMIPLDGMTIENGVVHPVITSAFAGSFDFSYEDICTSVKDFKCGIYFSPEVLAENPGLSVSLDLGLSETIEKAQNAEFTSAVEKPFVYDVQDMTSAVAICGPDYYTTVTGAVEVAVQTGDFVKLVVNAGLEDNLAINRDLVFNLGGKTLTANGKTLAIADSVVTITNGTLSAFTKDNVTLTGNAVLTVTDANVAASFRSDDTYYVSQNANGTHSIMRKSAFRVFITMVDGEPRIGFFKDCSGSELTYTLLGATNLENPQWTSVDYTKADDAAGASVLPLFWAKINQAADDVNVYRFFKIGPAPVNEQID